MCIKSDYIDVQPNTTYRLSAWLRGEIDAEESYGGWILRPVFYDANLNYLGYVNASSSSTVSSGWSEQGGNFTTPANAAYVKLELYDYMTSGWVAFDDVRLTVVNPSVVTRKNYYAGGTRIAVREGGELRYLLSDHLGSTALTASAGGAKLAELRYRAFGQTRYADGHTPTQRRFTGQVEDDTIEGRTITL